MRYVKHFCGATLLLLNSFITVLSACGLEIQNKANTISYNASSVIYDGSIKECGCTRDNFCVRKCCGVNYILDIDNKTCIFNNSTKLNVPPRYKDGDLVKDNSGEIRIVPGMSKCTLTEEDYRQIVVPDSNHDHIAYAMLNDDRLWNPQINRFFDHDEYCLESSEKYGLIAFLCFDHFVDDFNFADRLSFIGMIISLPFLLITFIVYALLPQRNLHGMSLMCYVFALFVADFLLVFSHVYTGEMTFVGCRAIGMIHFFCFMASIFWMNVMSFDICSTFSGSRGFAGSKKRRERKRFLNYSLYAWGVPLLIVALVVTLSQVVKPNVWYDPGVRGAECFLRDGYPELLYFYTPLALLITANIVMFIVTTCKIKKVQKDTKMLTKRGSKKHCAGEDDKQTFKLYIRLLFAMGLNWSVEIINWAVNWQVKNVPPAVWYLTDFCNAAYGVVIFFLFVFKKNIWKQLRKRYNKMAGKEQTETTLTLSSSIKR